MRAPPALTISRVLAAWWSSVAIGRGIRIAGRPTAVSSAIVEAHPALALLYLNNNLHIVHHANPAVAWYDLPELYKERRELFLAANEHTLFDGYGDIVRRFAFRVKQPVDHPFMYRDTQSEAVAE